VRKLLQGNCDMQPAVARSQHSNISTKKPFLAPLKVVILNAGNNGVICCIYCRVSEVFRVRMPSGLRVTLHLRVWPQSDLSPTSLVSEWPFTYLLGLRVTLHLLSWSQSNTSATSLISEWPFTYHPGLRMTLHLPPWSQSDSSPTSLVSE